MNESFESAHPFFGPRPAPLRAAAAALLRGASRVLDRLAQQLSAAQDRQASAASAQHAFEFHVEPEAADGALYVDGRLVGFLPGVRRL